MTAAPRQPVEAWSYAMTALLFSVACGALVVTLAVFAARISQHGWMSATTAATPSDSVIAATRAEAARNPLAPPGPPPPGIDATAPAVNLVLGGVLAGFFCSACVAWFMLAPLGMSYRRGAFSLAAAMGTMLPMLLATALDYAFQQAGLIALVLGCIAFAAMFWRKLQRVEIAA